MQFKCTAEVEAPNANMHKFNGTISLNSTGNNSNDKKSLNLNNVAYRGMSLRNSEWIIGLVIYTGSHTRI